MAAPKPASGPKPSPTIRAALAGEAAKAHRVRVPRASAPTAPASSETIGVDAGQVYADAQDAFAHGQYVEARDGARRYLSVAERTSIDPDKGWLLVGGASCFLKDVDTAKDAHTHGSAKAKQYIHNVCQRNGIEVQ